MGRGHASGGKRSKESPDWLNPGEPSPAQQPAREEKPRRRRHEDDDEEEEHKSKKGIKVWRDALPRARLSP